MTTETIEKPARRAPEPHHGVKTPELFATIGVVANQPELARFTWRAQGSWVFGTHMRSTMSGFYGAGGEQDRGKTFTADADHPAVLCGEDNGPTPVEYVLHALAACLTAGIANIAAARGVELEEVESVVEGDMDLRGILGLSDEVRNGFEGIRIRFRVKGDAPAEKLAEIVEHRRRRARCWPIWRWPSGRSGWVRGVADGGARRATHHGGDVARLVLDQPAHVGAGEERGQALGGQHPVIEGHHQLGDPLEPAIALEDRLPHRRPSA